MHNQWTLVESRSRQLSPSMATSEMPLNPTIDRGQEWVYHLWVLSVVKGRNRGTR